jgi:hypothetical protein
VRGRLIGPGEKPTRGHATLAKEIGGVDAPEILAADLTAEAAATASSSCARARGRTRSKVKAPGLATRRLDVDVRARGRNGRSRRRRAGGRHRHPGRVRDAANQPIENAKVSTYDETSPSTSVRMRAARTCWPVCPPARTRSRLRPRAWVASSARRKAGASGIDFVLQPRAGSRASWWTRRAADRGLSRPRHNPDRRDLGALTQDNFAATDGRFVVEDVGEGKYLLYVRAPDRADTVIAHVKVAAEGTTTWGTVRLVPGGIVRASWSTPVPRPSPARPPSCGGDTQLLAASPEVTTDAEGAFEVRGVSPGTAQVTVTHPAFALGFASGMEVDPARGPVETRVVMSQGGRIEGQVRGVLPVGAFVDVRSLSPGADGVLRPMLPSQPVAPDGTFVVEHIPTGRIAVALLTRGERRYNSVAEVEAEVRESETTRVEIVLRHVAVGGAELLEGAASRRSSSRGARR